MALLLLCLLSDTHGISAISSGKLLLSDLSWSLWEVGFYPAPCLPHICFIWGSPIALAVSKRGSAPLPLSPDCCMRGTAGRCMLQLMPPPRDSLSSHPWVLALCLGCPFLEMISRWGQEGSGATLGSHHVFWLRVMLCSLRSPTAPQLPSRFRPLPLVRWLIWGDAL